MQQQTGRRFGCGEKRRIIAYYRRMLKRVFERREADGGREAGAASHMLVEAVRDRNADGSSVSNALSLKEIFLAEI